MAHTILEKKKLLNRVRRIRGQIEAIERALEEEAGCSLVMQQISSCRGAMNGLMAVVVEDHVHAHFSGTPDVRAAGDELLEVVRSYLK
jgi:FrmR/RcnR family transcriptional regulator, repressor of frmRAB operon